MTKTLEDIKEMNIPIGAPVELTINVSQSKALSEMYGTPIHKELVYFTGLIEKGDKNNYEIISCELMDDGKVKKKGYALPFIEDIIILKYKK
jgi:hypothetical protein